MYENVRYYFMVFSFKVLCTIFAIRHENDKFACEILQTGQTNSIVQKLTIVAEKIVSQKVAKLTQAFQSKRSPSTLRATKKRYFRLVVISNQKQNEIDVAIILGYNTDIFSQFFCQHWQQLLFNRHSIASSSVLLQINLKAVES